MSVGRPIAVCGIENTMLRSRSRKPMRRPRYAGSSAEYNSRICGFGVMTRIPANRRADPRLRVGLHRPGTPCVWVCHSKGDDKMQTAKLFLLLALTMGAAANAQTQTRDRERSLHKIKQGRIAAMLENNAVSLSNQKIIGVQKPDPYTVDIGVYGMDEPSIYPNETWVWLACFSQPGVSYDEFSLVWVDIEIYLGEDNWWLSTDGDNDRGICDVNRGVDTTFIAIPRGTEALWWNAFIVRDEQTRKNIRVGRTIRGIPHVYNSQP